MKKTPMPRVVQDPAVAVWQDKIYLFGGVDEENNPLFSSLVYDPVNDSWSDCPDLPYSIGGNAFIRGDAIYFTRSSLGSQFLVYHPSEDRWEEGSDFPAQVATRSFYSTLVENFIFFFPIDDIVPAVVLAYSPTTNEWYNGTSSRWTFNEMAAATSYQDKVFITGGFRSAEFKGTCHIYDLSVDYGDENAWTKIAGVFEDDRVRHRSEAVDGKVYVLGGDNYGPVLRSVEVYDISTGTSKKVSSMLEAREEFISAVYDGKIYVMGGYNGKHLTSVEEYDSSRDRRNE